MVHTNFGDNRDPFSSFLKEKKAKFFYKKHKTLKNWGGKKMGDRAGTGEESRGSKFWGNNLEGKKKVCL